MGLPDGGAGGAVLRGPQGEAGGGARPAGLSAVPGHDLVRQARSAVLRRQVGHLAVQGPASDFRRLS